MVRCTFNPPEEELINYYLNNKITEKDDLDGKQINEVNICHYEPADLPGLAKIESSHTWYFISPVEKFGRLNRTKRASRSGHWKITGNSRTVKDVDGNPIGLKKFLVFQENKRSSTCSSSTTNTQQHKANWIIHEFHSFLHHPNQDAYVLCKLKKNTRTRRTAAVADASLAMIDLSLTSDPVVLNHSQPIILEGGESSGLPSGENGHVYGPNTRENSNMFQPEVVVDDDVILRSKSEIRRTHMATPTMLDAQ
ncbi:hypothetical protein CARUB_v10011623mg [Capsella rubella]|uniref:NAC domain-containing protein n=1 Tax=Capsella rubella TaxID=81985 RepID=R0GLB4_9BRAS|nr:hypothetical protein CARUB_v10011623mg [Capsella rubella]